jgi:parallel beta-helix repeat protein
MEKTMTDRNTTLVTRFLIGLCGLSQIAAGATLCVAPRATSACPYTSINAAVNAAAAGDIVQVSQGTYHEDVIIGKSISLIGDNEIASVFIDATGLPNGIYVDGLDNGGLVGVTVSGFQVENANFEGILVTNASETTISDNHVLNNNLNLNINTATCSNSPSFETNEGFDCGEGIHLSGVDHSIVADNLVENNAGGILLSDDTGATHDNLVLGNTVRDNPFDCGITLASHPLLDVNATTSAGVFHNTITGNTSVRNGFQVPGAGAGVGLFSPAPFNKTYGNVVVNNILRDNGLPGVAMHAHSPGANLADNMIVGNQISGNGADTEDTATPGPTGINVSGGDNGSGSPLAVIPGTIIAGNTIDNEMVGIAVKTNALVAAHLNNLMVYPQIGVDNLDGGTVDARLNWWGCPNGPLVRGCSRIMGSGILFLPFLGQQF